MPIQSLYYVLRYQKCISYVLGARVIESSTCEHGSEGLRESLYEVHLPVLVRQLLRVIPGTTVVSISSFVKIAQSK